MKKIITLLTLLVTTTLVLSSCGKKESGKIIIGATIDPHAQILKQVVEDLKAEGIELEIKEFTAWELLNTAVAEKELDGNFFQHLPYLENDVEKSGNKLVSIGAVHIEPMGIYSNKITSIEELSDGAEIAIPDDATNGGRALLLLENHNIITLKDGAGIAATKEDIVKNPKNIVITPLDAAIIPRALDDVDIAVINSNYALNAGLSPKDDTIVIESTENNPYANVIAVREEDKDKPELKKLIEILQSDKVKTFINNEYNGEIIPAS